MNTAISKNNWDIVLVTYNSADDLKRNWADRAFPDWVNIIVVDNGSTDESLTVARRNGFRAVSSTNVGLAKSNNRGAKAGSARFIAFCNPDVRLDPTDLERLGAILDESNCIVAPRLCGDDGTPQPNARRWPTVWRVVANRLRPSGRIAKSYQWPTEEPDWVTGAFVGMRRQLFERSVQWSPKYFLYFEDVELCQKAQKSGIPIQLADDVQVTHSWRRDSAKLLSRTTWWHLKSAARFYASNPARIVR